ncbi:MAG: DUF4234 domain-containing protein [Deltaproteobacteria bacterium]|nr:DUF4234 domain-containing protein [Deltaproteobacteria bacterium]MBW1915635.1 DUF4234 domain-containing protein [Deltaproteobacteria bacterium]
MTNSIQDRQTRDIFFSPHIINIPLYLLLTIVTLGIFNLYWNYRQMKACNDMLKRDAFIFWLWFLLCLLTFGLWHIYYQYKMGSAIVEIQEIKNIRTFDNLPLLSTLLTIFGLTIITDCIHQNEINKLAKMPN